jgi:pimeloyl-ACP methyl ester carboxylesterase
MHMTNRVGRPNSPLRRAAVASALFLVVVVALSLPGLAQERAGVAAQAAQVPPSALVLASRGSFMVGGESVLQTPAQLSSFTGQPLDSGGHVTINQMYVEYMAPVADNGIPVVMLHGATLSGKSYDTTPDGRMGWYEYFVRQGHPVYVPDQVSRARSGVDIATYNEVRAGVGPLSDLPNFWRFSDELAWTQFRFGPAFGTPFADTQFPVEAAAEFSRQAIPDFNTVLPTPNPNIAATAALAARLNGALLLGHSQTGTLPLDAALANPAAVNGLILVEPGGCRSTRFTDEQIATLATKPILVVFGDHLDAVTGTVVSWRAQYNDCQAFIARVNAAGGAAEMLHPPDLGLYGNSHMIMQDRNNLQIADLILAWIDRTQPRYMLPGKG